MSELSIREVVEAAHAQGLRLTTDEHTDFDQTGLDFRVVHVADERGVPWIVRTPRRPDVIDSARVEARILTLVSKHLPVEVPSWRVHCDKVIAYPRLDGTPAVTIGAAGPNWNVIDPKAPGEAFLDSYARVIAAIHAIDIDEAKKIGVPVRSISRARATIATAIEATRKVLTPTERIWSRWQRWLADEKQWSSLSVAFVHGDLHPGHMLLAKDGRLTGVLDWTEAQVSDPSIDLAMFAGAFGETALDAFIARLARLGGYYEAVDLAALARQAVERFTVFPALCAEWALRTNNDAVLEFARGQLRAIDTAND